MKRFAILAVFLALEGCVSLPAIHLLHGGAKAASAAPAPASKPVCSTTLTASIPAEPQLPAGADLPAAETVQMSAAEAVYFTWLKSFAQWAHGLQARLAQAQNDCAG